MLSAVLSSVPVFRLQVSRPLEKFTLTDIKGALSTRNFDHPPPEGRPLESHFNEGKGVESFEWAELVVRSTPPGVTLMADEDAFH